MPQYLGRLVSRGVQSAGAVIVNGKEDKVVEVPAWGAALLALTAAVFVVFAFATAYTLDDVVGTLAMIETPTNAIALPQSEEEADKKDGLLLEESASVPVKPITAKIRTTVKHITAIGGRWARWRGLVPAMLYAVTVSTVETILGSILPRFIPARQIVAELLAMIMFARFHMVWTHALISMPSSLRWYQRLAPFKSMKKLWLPTAVHVVALYAATYLTMGFALIMGACNSAMLGKTNGKPMSNAWWILFVIQAIAIVIFGLTMALFIVLPASATLARVEASMLPEDQETIVPFDRSFGGKVVPEALGGTGAIGFVDAWRTFDWEARRRLLKLYVKSFLIQVGLILVGFQAIAFVAWAIMGPEFTKAVAAQAQSVKF